jgi:diguanylate cyclase (GGDEF)-like protein/PAS domain S-box-containing protein
MHHSHASITLLAAVTRLREDHQHDDVLIQSAAVAALGHFALSNVGPAELLSYAAEVVLQALPAIQVQVAVTLSEAGTTPMQAVAGADHMTSVGLYVPISVGDRHLGHIQAYLSEGRVVDRTDYDLLITLGHLLVSNLERLHIAEALGQSEARFRALVQQATDLVTICDAAGVVRYMSPSVSRILGFTPEEMLGVSSFSFLHPEDLARISQGFVSKTEVDDTNPPVVMRLRHQDGSWRWLQATITNMQDNPVIGGLVINARDITEQHIAEQRLHMLEAVVEYANDAVLVTTVDQLDESGPQIIYVNPAFTRQTGYAAHEVIGRSPRILQGPGTSRVNRDKLHAALQSRQPIQVELLNYRRDGSPFWVELSIAPVFEPSGALIYMQAVQRDITTRRKNEDLERDRRQVLALIANDASLEATCAQLASMIETQLPGLRVAMLLRDSAGRIYAEAQPLPVNLLGDAQLAPISEVPISSADGSVLGTILMYAPHGKPLAPSVDKEAYDLIVAAARLAALAIERRRLHEQLRYRAEHDELTALPNRYLLNQRLTEAMEVARQSGGRVSLVFIDLDGFKQINDTLGHPAGDQLLAEVARRFSATLATSDIIARAGGDEFLLVVSGQPDDANILASIRSILRALASPFSIAKRELFITASIGVAQYPRDGDDAVTLLKHADIALYRSKSNGKNAVTWFRPDLEAAVVDQLNLEQQLHHAIQRGELRLHYQPQISLVTGQLVGMEALIRWEHPLYGLIAPGRFIPLAEESGLIVPVGAWAINAALKQITLWRAEGRPRSPISVNISARQFVQPGFIPQIISSLERYGVDPASLELEITESIMMREADHVSQQLTRLRQLGVRVAIDDFGTGYSSLAYLQKMPIERLKIDQGFVRPIGASGDERDAALIQAIITLAHSLGMDVVAEGVEFASQVDRLRALGCDVAQGYFFARPLPPELFWQSQGRDN